MHRWTGGSKHQAKVKNILQTSNIANQRAFWKSVRDDANLRDARDVFIDESMDREEKRENALIFAPVGEISPKRRRARRVVTPRRKCSASATRDEARKSPKRGAPPLPQNLEFALKRRRKDVGKDLLGEEFARDVDMEEEDGMDAPLEQQPKPKHHPAEKHWNENFFREIQEWFPASGEGQDESSRSSQAPPFQRTSTPPSLDMHFHDDTQFQPATFSPPSTPDAPIRFWNNGEDITNQILREYPI